jgi:hypothetical protein
MPAGMNLNSEMETPSTVPEKAEVWTAVASESATPLWPWMLQPQSAVAGRQWLPLPTHSNTISAQTIPRRYARLHQGNALMKTDFRRRNFNFTELRAFHAFCG